MTKVLYLLSIIILAVTAFFSWQNKQAFTSARLERQKINQEIQNTHFKQLKEAAVEVAKVDGDLKEVQSDIDQNTERGNQAKITLKNAETACEGYKKDIAEKEERKKDLESKLQTVIKDLPAGVGIDNLNEHINQMKTTIADNNNKVQEAEKATKAKQDELKKTQDQLEEINKRIEERKRLFDRNGMSATIVAVNNDWGFVVIDAGENKKITTDTKLLVTRSTESGPQTVGKLDIVSVEGNKTIANIVQQSVQSGVSIAPGDHVILENLMQ